MESQVESQDSRPRSLTSGQSREANEQVHWTAQMTRQLICLLQKQCNLGNQYEDGFTPESYVEIASRILDIHGRPVDSASVEDKTLWLKEQYTRWKDVRSRSEFGWDPEKELPTAGDDVWERYFQVSIFYDKNKRMVTHS